MANFHEAMHELGIGDYQIDGLTISNATEFKSKFRKITSYDSNNVAQFSTDPNDFGVTWTQIKNKMTEMDNAAPAAALRASVCVFVKDKVATPSAAGVSMAVVKAVASPELSE